MTPERFTELAQNHFKFRFFLISRLPMAWIAGLRVKHLDENLCDVTIPYKYWTKNPFRSMYFAAQSMAAELSTGLFCFRYAQLSKPSVSMLVVRMDATYHKKAIGVITFTCDMGMAIKACVQRAIDTGEGQTIEVMSTGRDEQGEVVSEFRVTWSFKAKTKRAG